MTNQMNALGRAEEWKKEVENDNEGQNHSNEDKDTRELQKLSDLKLDRDKDRKE